MAIKKFAVTDKTIQGHSILSEAIEFDKRTAVPIYVQVQ